MRRTNQMPKASKVKIIKADGTVVFKPPYKSAREAKKAVYNQFKRK